MTSDPDFKVTTFFDIEYQAQKRHEKRHSFRNVSDSDAFRNDTTSVPYMDRTLTSFCILHLLPLASVFDVPYLLNDVGRANLLAELLLLQSGVLTFSSSGFSHGRRLTVLLIRLHATSFFLIYFFYLFFCLYSVYDFIINICNRSTHPVYMISTRRWLQVTITTRLQCYRATTVRRPTSRPRRCAAA